MSVKKKIRCKVCRKKLGLTAIPCKCKNCYCYKCKADHKCTFDYNKEQIEKLKKELVKVEFQKVDKIS